MASGEGKRTGGRLEGDWGLGGRPVEGTGYWRGTGTDCLVACWTGVSGSGTVKESGCVRGCLACFSSIDASLRVSPSQGIHPPT